MRAEDAFRFSLFSLSGNPTRTWLMLLAMAIGVGSVVVLSALGEGARHYVMSEFSKLGTHLLIVLPGRSETTGGQPPLMGETPRDLTLDDALALTRSRAIQRIAPVTIGSAPVSYRQREREVTIIGSTPDLLPIRHLKMRRGTFLPEGDPGREAALVVLGGKLKHELFGNQRAMGQWVRIADRRFRVVGILKREGQSLGMDMGDTAFIPVASAQALFNTTSLFRIMVQAKSLVAIPKAEQAILDTIRKRHEGEDDVTVITQNALLSTFDDIFKALTFTVAGIGTISLAVAGILIMNVMLVAVSQRTSEISLLKALGSPPHQILRLFLLEAALLSVTGAVIGIAIAIAGLWGLEQVIPSFSISIPVWALVAAITVSLFTGLLFGVLPALRAARLDPVQALGGR